MEDKKKGCFSRIITILIILFIVGAIFDFFSGPKIEGNTAKIKIDLWYQGAAKNKEWAEAIWEGVQKEKVEHVIVEAKAEYVDKYGKSEKYEKEIDITSLISPLSEVRNYTRSKFAEEFGDYIVSWVSNKMAAYASQN